MTDVLFQSATETAAQLRAGLLSARELTEQVLAATAGTQSELDRPAEARTSGMPSVQRKHHRSKDDGWRSTETRWFLLYRLMMPDQLENIENQKQANDDQYRNRRCNSRTNTGQGQRDRDNSRSGRHQNKREMVRQ